MKSAADRVALATLNATLSLAALGLTLAVTAPATAREAPAVAMAGPADDYPMVLGDPFTVDGVTYTPADTMNYDAVGYAVADGAGEGAVTGAHRTLPLPSYVEVTALDSGRTVVVRLERRGPMAGDGLIALSPGAMAQLGLFGGHDPVRVRRVNPPENERAALRSGQQAPARMDTPPGLLAALKRKLGILPPVQPSPAALAAALGASGKPLGAATPPPMPRPTPKAAAPKPTAPLPAPTRVIAPTPAPAKAPAAKPPVAKPAVARAETPKAASEKTAPPKPAPQPAGKGYIVQVGAFSTRANADKAAKQVGGTVSPAGKFFRVHIGPSASQADATAALARAKRAGYADARVQRAP